MTLQNSMAQESTMWTKTLHRSIYGRKTIVDNCRQASIHCCVSPPTSGPSPVTPLTHSRSMLTCRTVCTARTGGVLNQLMQPNSRHPQLCDIAAAENMGAAHVVWIIGIKSRPCSTIAVEKLAPTSISRDLLHGLCGTLRRPSKCHRCFTGSARAKRRVHHESYVTKRRQPNRPLSPLLSNINVNVWPPLLHAISMRVHDTDLDKCCAFFL